MKLIIKIAGIVIFLSIVIGVVLPTNNSYAHHADLSTTLYQYERYIEEERYDKAYQLILQHEKELTDWFTNQTTGIATEELLSALRLNKTIIKDATKPQSLKLKHAQSLVIAGNALNNLNSPILSRWQEDIGKSILASIESNQQLSDKVIEEIVLNWNVIRPAVAVATEEDTFIELNNNFKGLSKNQTTEKNIEQLNQLYQNSDFFHVSNPTNPENNSTFIWLASIVGGFITFTLAYVAWKKYNGEKGKVKQNSNS